MRRLRKNTASEKKAASGAPNKGEKMSEPSASTSACVTRSRSRSRSPARTIATVPTSTQAATRNMDTLNPDVFKNFEKSGKIEFLKFIKHHLRDKENISLLSHVYRRPIANAIYDLLMQGVLGKIKKDCVLMTIGDIASLHSDMSEIVMDVFTIMDTYTSNTVETKPEQRKEFFNIARDIDKVLPEKLIKERMEIDTLQDVGIVKNKAFYVKFIKIKTKLYYKQRRYNLFREESEGYAKLITELNQEFEKDVTAESLMSIITSLIGCFNLDPNRVLDIIVESFEMRPDCCHVFVPLLRTYRPSGVVISEILGFKFVYFADSKTPRSLYHICAILLKHGVIDLMDLYQWLAPPDRRISAEWERELFQAKEFVRKLNVITTSKDKVLPEDIPEKDDNNKYPLNQKFGLCEMLLKVGDWENAFQIIKKMPEQCVVVHEPVARALADLIHISIDFVFQKNKFSQSRPHKSKLTEDVKLVQTIQAREYKELRNYALPMIITLGPSLHFDPVLMTKVLRVLQSILAELGVDSLNTPPPKSDSETVYYDVMTIIDSAILPALSYMDSNCCMAEEIWSVLKYFPYQVRYASYARWKNETYLLQPTLIRRRGEALQLIKAQMKRVSKENVKPVGRLIGKMSHCSPGALFDYILLQIQIYDNLITPVVDSLKYLTSLSFDCLGYCLVEALSLADRDRFKHDGTSISMWLQSLANFCGAIFKKYNIELSGLLQFVANQLKMQKSLDLLILKEIVQKMAGVETVEEMTTEQLNALCGGELLRGEAGYFSQVRNTKKSSQRLKDALANNDLAVGLCLLMAQQKHCVIYRETTHSHLKLVGKLYDQCQDTLVQFGTFLGSTYSVDEYVERLPSIIVMLQEYHINTDVAFFLARPMFTHQINQKYDQLRKSDPNAKKLNSLQKLQKYLEATSFIMNPIVESVRPLHSLRVWEDISPQFLVTFWSLSMYDLQVPVDSYQKEINRLKQLSMQVAESKDTKNKKEQDRYIALMEKLQDERRKQQEHVDKILQRLNQEKDNWFLSRSGKSAKNETITQFLQLCLFPRCTFTALDALYCAKFVHTIHNLKSANFSTLLCYDRIFCDITYSITSCTENEATRYGRFLCAMLETVMRWHADSTTFNKECANYPGFVTKFRVSNQFSEASDHVGYENYRHVCHKWHYKITKAIVFCLDSKEYMQIRNAFIILMRILPHYPVLAKLAQIIERKVEKVREDERNKRPDLFVIASSYIGQLKTKAAQMIKESDFHQVSERQLKLDAQASNKLNVSSTSTSSVFTSSTDVAPSQSTSIDLITSPAAKKVSNGDLIIEKREKERLEKGKTTKPSNSGNASERVNEVRERDTVQVAANSGNSTSRSISLIDIKDDVSIVTNDRDHERQSSSRSLKDLKREERTRERENRERERELREREREREQREREREREHEQRSLELDMSAIAGIATPINTRSKREKRREERFRMESPAILETVEIVDKHEKDRSGRELREREQREREHDREYERGGRVDRDLSSVSNESNGSLQRRNQDYIEYDKESKRRKLDTTPTSSKKHTIIEGLTESTKKERTIKSKERKEKLTDEERDARRLERKLGRKRERLEETSSSLESHKRRRDVQNGDDDLRDRDKYHNKEKTPHLRERSHEKFERDRNMRDDRQYGTSKTTRSRIGY